MRRYLVRRSLAGAVQLLLLVLLIFVVVRATGNPTDLLLPATASAEQHRRLEAALGLDQPLVVQFGIFLRDLASGDLGRTFAGNRPVSTVVGRRLWNSTKLAAASLIVIILWSIPLGVLAAKKRGRLDRLAHFLAVLGFAVPNFLLAILFILLFAIVLDLLPSSGMGSPAHYVGPSVAIGTAIGAGMMRLMRSGMLQIQDQPYIHMARSKGLPEWRITWLHEFRMAVTSVLTYGGMYLGTMIGGSVVVEVVFAWPGLGRLAYEAVLSRDFPIIQAVVIVLGAVIILGNLVVDVLYAYIDPRVRVGAQ